MGAGWETLSAWRADKREAGQSCQLWPLSIKEEPLILLFGLLLPMAFSGCL